MTPQQRDAEFLRRNHSTMTLEEVERYAFLAGAKALHETAVRAIDAEDYAVEMRQQSMALGFAE